MKKIFFFLQQNGLIIFSSVILLIIIGGVGYFQIQKPQEEVISYFPILLEPPKDFNLISPVEKRYFDTAFISPENPQRIIFYLDVNEPIRAVFNGRVERIYRDQMPFPNDYDPSFQEIILYNQEKTHSANYVFTGEALVYEGQEIKQGDILAMTGDRTIGWLNHSNLSLWIHDLKVQEILKISLELFQ